MKILVLGGNGMLGHTLVRELGRSFDVFATVRGSEPVLAETGICRAEKLFTSIDASEFERVEKVVRDLAPDIVINAIGVIKHREESKDTCLSIEMNSLLPHRTAAVSRQVGARFLTFSTDCVFSGAKGAYVEEDATDCNDLYGKSKALGEVTGDGCLTLRTSIIGRELEGSRSLIEWVISNRGGAVKGFANAIYSGFTTVELSRIVEMVIKEHSMLNGIYHVSSDPIDKFELIGLINRKLGLGIAIEKDVEFVIDRSLVSKRFREETGYSPKSWEDMIEEMAGGAADYEEWRKLRF